MIFIFNKKCLDLFLNFCFISSSLLFLFSFINRSQSADFFLTSFSLMLFFGLWIGIRVLLKRFPSQHPLWRFGETYWPFSLLPLWIPLLAQIKLLPHDFFWIWSFLGPVSWAGIMLFALVRYISFFIASPFLRMICVTAGCVLLSPVFFSGMSVFIPDYVVNVPGCSNDALTNSNKEPDVSLPQNKPNDPSGFSLYITETVKPDSVAPPLLQASQEDKIKKTCSRTTKSITVSPYKISELACLSFWHRWNGWIVWTWPIALVGLLIRFVLRRQMK